MEELLEQKLAAAKKGRKQWRGLLYTTRLEPNEYIILFPSLVRDYNYYGMLYLDTFLQRNGGAGAVLLTYDPMVKEQGALLSKRVKSIVHFSREQAEELMQYYCLTQFDHRLKIISLNEPFGRNAENLIDVNRTTIEQLIAVGVYGIIPYRPIER